MKLRSGAVAAAAAAAEECNYTIVPKHKKSVYEITQYIKVLSTGKKASIYYTLNWRWGKLIVSLNDPMKKVILNTDYLCLNDYFAKCDDLDVDDLCESFGEYDDQTYTQEEINEILESVCELPEIDDDETVTEDGMSNDDDDEDENELNIYDCNPENMDENGWSIQDVQYYIDGGCVLIPEGMDINKYLESNKKDENDVPQNNSDIPIVSVELPNVSAELPNTIFST